MGRVYGDLSGAAHVSQAELLKNFVVIEIGEQRAPSLLPVYRGELSRNLYALQTSYMIMIAWLASDIHGSLYGDQLNEDESKLLAISQSRLVETGLMNFEPAT